MLAWLNGLDEVAWAGLLALITTVLGAIGAAWKGTHKHPIEVGMPPPPVDQVPYILEEVRVLNRLHKEGTEAVTRRFDELERLQHEQCKLCDARFDDLERLGNKVHLDTQVLRERGPR